MANIIINSKDHVSFTDLERYVMRYVYEKENMASSEVKLMFNSFRFFKEQAEQNYDEPLLFCITHLAKIVLLADAGKFEYIKATFKEHGIYVFKKPSVKDFARAREIYAKYKREHPDTEQTGNPN